LRQRRETADNYVFFQQESAIKCLILVHNDTSVRILGGSRDDVDEEEIAPKVTYALAQLNLPRAPIAPNQRVNKAEAFAKWKQWWAANKDNYVAKTGSSSPAP
jgi:hypothetical protein